MSTLLTQFMRGAASKQKGKLLTDADVKQLNDLFGQPIAEATALARPRKIGIGGRGFKGGYFMQPGSGPTGETCKTCAHYRRVRGGARAYPKCLKMKHAWTSGPGSDIKAKMAACSGWEKKPEASQ